MIYTRDEPYEYEQRASIVRKVGLPFETPVRTRRLIPYTGEQLTVGIDSILLEQERETIKNRFHRQRQCG